MLISATASVVRGLVTFCGEAMYSELVYFAGAHFLHIAAYEDHCRLQSLAIRAQTARSKRCSELIARLSGALTSPATDFT